MTEMEHAHAPCVPRMLPRAAPMSLGPTRRRTLGAGAAALLLVMGGVSAGAASSSGRKVALVIGNGGYRYVPRLTNPPHDARLIATTLDGVGFTLVGGGAQIDLDRTQFEQALATFQQEIRGADVALFYYSGHGMQVGGPTGWCRSRPTRPGRRTFRRRW